MATAPDILFHRYFQQLPPQQNVIYRGKKDLGLVEEPLRALLRGIQVNLNQALVNERRNVPEHVPHAPFHLDSRYWGESPRQTRSNTVGVFCSCGGTFLFVRTIKTLTPENIYSLCHPLQAARMDFIMRSAVNWCRSNRAALASWMNPATFGKIMSTLAYVTPEAGSVEGRAAQTAFLHREVGDAYMKTLGTKVDQYIQSL